MPDRSRFARLALRWTGAGLCGLAAACAAFGPAPPPAGTLEDARLASNKRYPRQIGSYLPHAECVNAAVEIYAVPSARYPDLVRRQEEARLRLSQAIDQRRLDAKTAARRMTQIDGLVARATLERDAGDTAAAIRRLRQIEKLLP